MILPVMSPGRVQGTYAEETAEQSSKVYDDAFAGRIFIGRPGEPNVTSEHNFKLNTFVH